MLTQFILLFHILSIIIFEKYLGGVAFQEPIKADVILEGCNGIKETCLQVGLIMAKIKNE